VRAVEKNGDPRRKAAQPKEHHPRVYPRRSFRRWHAHVLRDEQPPSHITFRPHSVGNRAVERQRKRERERGGGGEGRGKTAERKKRGRGNDSNAAE